MLFAILAPVVHAATLSVGTSDGYGSIADAIDASENGDRIEVSAGTYNESLNLNGKAITLIGVDGPAETFIIGTGTPTIVVDSGEGRESVISGFPVLILWY